MTEPASGEITLLLQRLGEGDRQVLTDLAPLVLAELRRLAAGNLRDRRHTWQPTDLVNELWVRLLGRGELRFQNRAHFIGVAANLMRVIVIDHARERCARKRTPAGAVCEDLTEFGALLALTDGQAAELVTLDDALCRLAAMRPRQAQIVEMRYFGGLTVEETGQVLGVSPKTVKREWAASRAWLHAELYGAAS